MNKVKLPLEKHVLEGLLAHLESVDGCDNTLKHTKKYLQGIGVWREELIGWFGKYGGYCDCEVVFNVLLLTPEELSRKDEALARSRESYERGCVVCGESVFSPSYYMVTDEVWRRAGFSPEDHAHAACVAKRLGRPLIKDDFKDCGVNDVARAIFGPLESEEAGAKTSKKGAK